MVSKRKAHQVNCCEHIYRKSRVKLRYVERKLTEADNPGHITLQNYINVINEKQLKSLHAETIKNTMQDFKSSNI